jgi:hypothetical protein
MPSVRGNVQTLAAAAARTTSGNTGALNLSTLCGGEPDACQFILNVTASSAPTTLDVYLQWSPDAGTTFYDFGHFTQVGAVSTSIQSLLWTRRDNDGTGGTGVIVTGDAALAAAKVLNGPIATSSFRAKWVIAGTSYTFSLIACLDRD